MIGRAFDGPVQAVGKELGRATSCSQAVAENAACCLCCRDAGGDDDDADDVAADHPCLRVEAIPNSYYWVVVAYWACRDAWHFEAATSAWD